ncbi:MAG: hypothetical protein ABIW38_15695 [Ferruginibacter sp.]
MRYFLIYLLLQGQLSFAQNPDSLINTMYNEKTDSARIKRIYDIIENNGALNPKDVIFFQTKILEVTKQHKDKICEAVITAELGYSMANIHDLAKGTAMIFEALRVAEKTTNQQAIGIAYHDLALIYFGTDEEKALDYLKKALTYSKASNNYYFICSETGQLGFYHLGKNNLDSALFYMQDAYGQSIKYNVQVVQSYILSGLSTIQSKLGNKQLAREYLNTALKIPYLKLDAGALANTYSEIAEFYNEEGTFDSSLQYAYKAWEVGQKTFFSQRINYAGLLKRLYNGKNSDSALKYTNIYYKAKDSVGNNEQIQKLQLLSFEENIRQEKIKQDKDKSETERKHNIQYAAIAIGIISFIILFLLLSRSIIVNTRIIEFLGATALLVVFEFINLIIHPYLAHYTNDSPLTMLLVLVIIAMLLVPFHHKLEKWAKTKLVEKNKQIRLAAAKKTIEKLSKNTDEAQ